MAMRGKSSERLLKCLNDLVNLNEKVDKVKKKTINF